MKKSLILLISLLFVTGCSNWQQRIGYKKSTPDESRVIAYPPLSIPPTLSIDQLQTTGPAATKEKTVKNIIVPDDNGQTTAITPTDKAFINKF